MKKIILMVIGGLVLASCNNPTATEATDQQSVAVDSNGTVFNIDKNASMVTWEGYKTGGSHNGTVNITEGTFTAKMGVISAGSFVIDLTSIKNSDITDTANKAVLIRHLNDTDFFNTKKWPTAKFEITNVSALTNDTAGNTNMISGNLTIKGITKNISFPAKVMTEGDNLEAKGTVTIDRLQWDIKYNSKTVASPAMVAKLKDKFIKDEIKIGFDIKARK